MLSLSASLAQNCDVAEGIANGGFENLDSPCDQGVQYYTKAFNEDCVPSWFAANGTPDIADEAPQSLGNPVVDPYEGDFFAFMVANKTGSVCKNEAIGYEFDLEPGYGYDLTFRMHAYDYLTNRPVEVYVYYTSGVTPVDNSSSGPEPCLNLPSGDRIYYNSYFDETDWVLPPTAGNPNVVNGKIRFVATSDKDQIIIFPEAIRTNADAFLMIDEVDAAVCSSELSAAIAITPESGLSYSFNDVTEEEPGLTVDAWCWEFGDGATSELESPTHTYSQDGAYEVCLTIRDSDGCIDTQCDSLLIGVDSCACAEVPLFISGEETWGTDRFVNHHIVVPAGNRLTIDDAEIRMARNCKIFVERGARLDVENQSLLTNACTEGYWGGIEVWGNGALAHPPIAQVISGVYPSAENEHGVVSVTGGSTVERSAAGIRSDNTGPYWQPYGNGPDWGLHWGGIIYADDAIFQNNRIGVAIQKFPHGSVADPQTYENVSRLLNTDFLHTETNPPIYGLNIWASGGVLVEGCVFDGFTGTAAFHGTDFTATVKSSTFEDSAFGIEADYTGVEIFDELVVGIAGVSTSGNTFQNLSDIGVLLRNAPGAKIAENDFSNTGAAGIYLWGPSLASVQFNDFGGSWTGVMSLQTSLLGNPRLDCNYYQSHLFSGVLAWGDNRNLRFNHETFNLPTQYDVWLLDYEEERSRIANQGQAGYPFFNFFSGDENIIADFSRTVLFNYHHPGDNVLTTYPSLAPQCDVFGLPVCDSGIENNFLNIEESNSLGGYDDGCLALPGIGDGVVDGPCDRLGCLDTLNQAIAGLKSYIDDGDTPGLLAAIDSDPNGSATYQSLRDAGPYLSDEVLNALLNSGMTGWKKDSLSLANGPLSYDMMQVAGGKVSAAVYQELEDQREQEGRSPREALAAQTADLEWERGYAIRALSEDYYDQQQYGAVDSLLEQEGEKERLLAFRLHRGDWTGAQTVLDSLPAGALRTVQQVNLDRLSGGYAYSLPPADSSVLMEIALGATAQAPAAQALLTLLTGETFTPPYPNAPGFNSFDPEDTPETGIAPASREKRFRVFPNPASGTVRLEWTSHLVKEQTIFITLYDLSGRPARQWRMNGLAVNLDLQRLPAGAYWLEARAGQQVERQRLVINP